MAQKVNTTNLRLKKRLNWDVTICTHNFNDYSNQILNATKVLTVNENLMRQLRISTSTLTLVKNSKIYKLNYEILDQRFFFYFTKIISASRRSLQNVYKYRSDYFNLFKLLFKNFMLNQNQMIHRISNTEIQKRSSVYNGIKKSFQLMSPKVITEFAKIQLTENNFISLKKNNFNKNLQGNLLNFINLFITEFKHDILGIKIICSGKWKKTRTGRKQKLYLKYGRIQTSNIANKILYHAINQKTKYGVCSIKVWIAHKAK